jgi:hypothetical protein
MLLSLMLVVPFKVVPYRELKCGAGQVVTFPVAAAPFADFRAVDQPVIWCRFHLILRR